MIFKGRLHCIRDSSRLQWVKEYHLQTKIDNHQQGHNLLKCKIVRKADLLHKIRSKTLLAVALYNNLYFYLLSVRAQLKGSKITDMQNLLDLQ